MASIIENSNEIKQLLNNLIDKEIDVKTNESLRLYKAIVTTAPYLDIDGKLKIGVKIAPHTTAADNQVTILSTTLCETAQVNDYIWVAKMYNSLNNAFAMFPMDFIYGAGIGAIKIKDVIDGTLYGFAFVTLAQYQTLDNGGLLEQNVMYYITDDPTLNDFNNAINNLSALISNNSLAIQYILNGTTPVGKTRYVYDSLNSTYYAFVFCTKAQYDALVNNNAVSQDTFYYITDDPTFYELVQQVVTEGKNQFQTLYGFIKDKENGAATANGTKSISAGSNSSSYGNYSSAFGNNAQAGNYSVAMGYNAKARNYGYGVAIGHNAKTNTTDGDYPSIAIGYGRTEALQTYADQGIAIGSTYYYNPTQTYIPTKAMDDCVAIGNGARAEGSNCTIIGTLCIGNDVYDSKPNQATVVGYHSGAGRNYDVVIGANCWTSSNGNGSNAYTKNVIIGHSVSGVTGQSVTRIGCANYSSKGQALLLGAGGVSFTYYNTTGSSWVSASDIRDKTDIEEVEHALDFILKLKPITYVMNEREKYLIRDEEGKPVLDKNGKQQYDVEAHKKGTKKKHRRFVGLSAQDTYKAMLESYNNNDNYAEIVDNNKYDNPDDEYIEQLSISYERLVPFLIKAIKEQQEQINQLKEEIDMLKKEIK